MYRKKIIDGIFEKTVTYDKRLSYCPNGSCGIVANNNNEIVLISYTSPIIWYNPDENTISFGYTAPDYSRTTIKHVISFLKEYIPSISYQDVKKLYYQDYEKTYKISEI